MFEASDLEFCVESWKSLGPSAWGAPAQLQRPRSTVLFEQLWGLTRTFPARTLQRMQRQDECVTCLKHGGGVWGVQIELGSPCGDQTPERISRLCFNCGASLGLHG